MPDDILGGQGATLLMAIAIVAVALMALAAVFWLIKARSSSTFIRGGRARQPRLAVLDAAAVDTRRRIVLIRRDDVEHLVMIGGPTDVVIESRIVHPDAPADRSAYADEAAAGETGRSGDRLPADLMATAKSIAQSARKPTRDMPADPAPSTPPAQPVATPLVAGSAAAAVASSSAATVGSMESEAADILETARARVFDEPDFDSNDPAVKPSGSPGQAPLRVHDAVTAPTAYEEVLFDEDALAESWSAQDEGMQPDPQPRPSVSAAPGPDFESVLAAELSEDLSLNPFDEGLIDDFNETPGQSVPTKPAQAPEVQSDTRPSRDSLEAEMERLLGDMTRKP